MNEFYDEGGIIKQFECDIETNDSPEDIAKKIHKLEMTFFPKVIQNLNEKMGMSKKFYVFGKELSLVYIIIGKIAINR